MDWAKVFQEQGAIWIHDGLKTRPHALLTSGLHSDGFVNCTYVTQQPRLLEQIVTGQDGLAPLLPQSGVDWVIGSAYGAITLAYSVARQIGCRSGFTEKDADGMKLSRFELDPSSKVLVVEDTISTGGSTLKTIEGIQAAGIAEANILPWVICLVNRSGQQHLGSREIRSLLRLDIHMWKPTRLPALPPGITTRPPKSSLGRTHPLTKLHS